MHGQRAHVNAIFYNHRFLLVNSITDTHSTTVNHSKSKSSNPNRRSKQMKQASHSGESAAQANSHRDENSIKRVMILVDKKIINNRSSYTCKWPNCGYESGRSDSLVRHIRSHTGERPYVCPHEGCQYATIQRSTLNKHLSRHINSTF